MTDKDISTKGITIIIKLMFVAFCLSVIIIAYVITGVLIG